jgi:hypothetical protein
MKGMEVFSLDEYRSRKNMERYKFKGDEFLLSSGVYFDRTLKAPLHPSHSIANLRHKIIDKLPKVSNGKTFQPLFNKMYVPTSMDFEPIWSFVGEDETFVNSGYQPLGILHLTMRDNPKEFYDFVNGIYVSSKEEYHRYLEEFNKLYERLLSGKGNGRYGLASLDEQIMLAGLVYIVLSTCESADGIYLEHGQIKNSWGRHPQVIRFNSKELAGYSAKLKSVWFSGLTPSQFFYRYEEKSDENCFWLISPPPFDSQRLDSYNNNEFKIDDLYQWVDYFIPLLSAKGSRVMLIFPTLSSTRAELVQYLGFKNVNNCLVNSNNLRMFDDISEYPGMRTSHMILNYNPKSTMYNIGD